MALIDMVNDYQKLLEKKESLAEETKDNNAKIEALKQEIAQQMIDDDCPRIAAGDYMFSLQIKSKYSKRSEEYLAVNAGSLQSAMNALVEENGELPEELAEVISQFDQTDILRRKQTSSALKKAKGGK